MKKIMTAFFVCLSLQSCFENTDNATSFLKRFVRDLSFGEISQEEYSNYLDGDLLNQIQAMTPEEFDSYNNAVKVGPTTLEILNENCKENSCTITYVTRYKTKTSDGSEYKTEVRKIAELQKRDDWKLMSIKNVKTYHETENAINPLAK